MLCPQHEVKNRAIISRGDLSVPAGCDNTRKETECVRGEDTADQGAVGGVCASEGLLKYVDSLTVYILSSASCGSQRLTCHKIVIITSRADRRD
eukprot:993195-Prorocentrum_minimum.AAC.6